jgi:hypothetical protein
LLMAYKLRSGVSYVWVGPAPVFLDLYHNRYFKLSPSGAAALRRLERGQMAIPGDAEILLGSGLISATEYPSIVAPTGNMPAITGSYFDQARRPSLGHVMVAVIDQLWALAIIRWVGLAAAVAKLERRIQRTHGHERHDDIGRLVGSYRLIDLLLSAENRCLVRSFALARSLTRYSVVFNLVIGVRTGPFGAHCWIQKGERSVSDHRDKAREYVPVLIL